MTRVFSSDHPGAELQSSAPDRINDTLVERLLAHAEQNELAMNRHLAEACDLLQQAAARIELDSQTIAILERKEQRSEIEPTQERMACIMIANWPDEDNEWDAVEKYKKVREIAQRALKNAAPQAIGDLTTERQATKPVEQPAESAPVSETPKSGEVQDLKAEVAYLAAANSLLTGRSVESILKEAKDHQWP